MPIPERVTLLLQDHFAKINPEDPESIKLSGEYYKWTSLKTGLILNEKNFQIPASALPNTIKPSSFADSLKHRRFYIAKFLEVYP